MWSEMHWLNLTKNYDEINEKKICIFLCIALSELTHSISSQSDCKIELIDKTLHSFSALIDTIIYHHYQHHHRRHHYFYSESYAFTLFWFPEHIFFQQKQTKNRIILHQYTWWQCKIVSCSKNIEIVDNLLFIFMCGVFISSFLFSLF